MVESTSSGEQLVEQNAEDVRMGGEGFGNVVMLMVIIGALVLVGVVVFAMLGLNGQFLHPHLDPPV